MTQRAPLATAGFFAHTCYRLESLRSCRVTIPSIVDDEIWAICSGEFGAPGRAYFGGRPWGASLLCSGKEAVVASCGTEPARADGAPSSVYSSKNAATTR